MTDGEPKWNNAPFVSVIVPTYKDTESLILCLGGLAKQSYPVQHFEVIVVNNDAENEIIGFEMASNVVLTNETKKGSYAARNSGIALSKGAVLAFTDADCVPHPDWIANGVTSFDSRDCSLTAGKVEFFFKESDPNIWEYIDAAGKMNQKATVEKYGYAATANLFVKREVFDKIGVFNDSLRSGGDYEFTRRAVRGDLKLCYCCCAIVLHPARSTFKEKYMKALRVAEGQSNLESLGLLEHSELSVRSFLPSLKVPEIEGRKLSAFAFVRAFLAQYVLKLINAGVRVRIRGSKNRLVDTKE